MAKLTKLQQARIDYRNTVRQVCAEKFYADTRYRAILTNLVNNIIACSNILDEYIQDFDNLTQRAYLNGAFRKSAKAIVRESNVIMAELIKKEPDNVLFQDDEQMVNMRTFATHLKSMINYTKELDEEGILKAVSTIKLLAK